LAPINRRTAENYLKEYAKEIKEEEKLNKLKDCHDPIGLASKPLFLDMVKNTLHNLPDEDLDELVLYEIYTQHSLEYKIENLENETLYTPKDMIIENMKEILETVAMELYKGDRAYVYLSEVHDTRTLTRRLWEMSSPDADTYEDENARIAVRSLLKRVETENEEGKQWPVDFCHRSMREFFVARAVCRMLAQKKIEEITQFLKNCYLSYEILWFASKIMINSGNDYTGDLLTLIRKTKDRRQIKRYGVGHLGCNAVSLLYKYLGYLPGEDWSGLALDGVDLAGADLSGKNFSGTSLQYANLDNINFTDADFSFCDFEGVRLEEAAPIQALTVSSNENIYAFYNNGIIREWMNPRTYISYSIAPGSGQIIDKSLLIVHSDNNVTLVQDQEILFFDKEKNQLQKKAAIKIKPRIKIARISDENILLSEDATLQDLLLMVDLKKQAVIKSTDIGSFVICDHFDDRAFVGYNKDRGLKIVDLSSQRKKDVILPRTKNEDIICMTTIQCKNTPSLYRIALGKKDGSVQILELDLEEWSVSQLCQYQLHKKTVNDIVFVDERRVLSGGFDKKLLLVKLDMNGKPQAKTKEFKIDLQCKGMKVDGVQPEEKRELLEKLIEKAQTVNT
jgi:hypothetical protein